MCQPAYFEVSYTINPWMDPNAWKAAGSDLTAQSKDQWEGLYRNFTDLGVTVDLHTPRPGVPDMVFTANAAVVLDRKALLARFLDPERQAEEKFHLAAFEKLVSEGVIDEVSSLPVGMFQEGAGDCLFDGARNLFWAGYGQRSRREAYPYIASFFDRKVVTLDLVDPRYYHVDTCLAVLNSGHIVYYPPAFSTESLERLRIEAGGEQWLIAAGEEDASQLGVNLVNIGTNVVMAVCSSSLEKKLNSAGFQVIRSPLPAFGMSGGAAACLTLRLH
jgi:N-dimethylarginine dimethylaminohydrolase